MSAGFISRYIIEELVGTNLSTTDQARHVSDTHESHRDAERRAALAVLRKRASTRSNRASRRCGAHRPCGVADDGDRPGHAAWPHRRDGDPFNLGEGTVTRAAVQIASGEVASLIFSAATRRRPGCAPSATRSGKARNIVRRSSAGCSPRCARGSRPNARPGGLKPRRPRWTSSRPPAVRTDGHAGASFPRAGGRKPGGVPRGHGRSRTAGRGQGIAARGRGAIAVERHGGGACAGSARLRDTAMARSAAGDDAGGRRTASAFIPGRA